MKKILAIIMLVCSIQASAQGTWQEVNVPADELLGVKAEKKYVYTQDSLQFEINMYKEQFLIRSNENFDTETIYKLTGQISGATVMVGLYYNNGKMFRKFDMWLDATEKSNELTTRNKGWMSMPAGQKTKVKEIINILTHHAGYIRIVAPYFMSKNIFDLKICSF